MRKTTTVLAGLSILAAVSIAPASAQTFTNSAPFNFAYSPTTFTVSSIAATFNPLVGSPVAGLLSISGGVSTDGISYSGSTLSFLTGSTTVSQTVSAFVFPSGPSDFISGYATPTAFSSGFTFDLLGGTPAAVPEAVPEASTVISFGALLVLGGAAVLRRKRPAQTAV